MKTTIEIENLKELKKLAIDNNVTLKEYVNTIIKKHLEKDAKAFM